MGIMFVFVFFFKQKTAYEMRISDGSSDVCSSDLDDAGHGAFRGGDTQGAVDHVTRLRWRGDGLCVIRNVFKHRRQVDLLLEVAAERRYRLLADNRDHRHVIHFGVVQPGQKMKRAGPGRSEEHTSELQSLMRISYAVFCLKQKKASNCQ